MSALAAVPANRKHAIARDITGKFLELFMISSRVLYSSTLRFGTPYGSVTERMFPENVPPVYVPATFSATAAPSVPALPGTATVKTKLPPAAMVPPDCGNGDPVAEPNVAEVRVTLVAGEPPVFFTVMVKV